MDLIALVYDGPGDAGTQAGRLARSDAGAAHASPGWAVVRWDRDSRIPRTEVTAPPAGSDTHAPWFWALVLGVTFSAPLLGAATGSATGLEAGSLTAAGVQDSFMNRLRDEVTPGRSALLVLTNGAPAVEELVQQRHAHLVGTVRFTPRLSAALLDVVS